MKFQAEIEYTEETCLRLAEVQNKCFGKLRNRIRLILALIPFIIGCLYGVDSVFGVLMILFAVMFYYKTAFMYQRDAKQAYEKTPEAYRSVSYQFEETSVLVRAGGKDRSVSYHDLHALRFDSEYGYLFINGQQAYMFSWKSLCPNEEREMLKALIQGKSGLSWEEVHLTKPFLFFYNKK